MRDKGALILAASFYVNWCRIKLNFDRSLFKYTKCMLSVSCVVFSAIVTGLKLVIRLNTCLNFARHCQIQKVAALIYMSTVLKHFSLNGE